LQIFEKQPNIKFHENQSSVSGFMRTDRRDAATYQPLLAISRNAPEEQGTGNLQTTFLHKADVLLLPRSVQELACTGILCMLRIVNSKKKKAIVTQDRISPISSHVVTKFVTPYHTKVIYVTFNLTKCIKKSRQVVIFSSSPHPPFNLRQRLITHHFAYKTTFCVL
jgi:hypothetical protein